MRVCWLITDSHATPLYEAHFVLMRLFSPFIDQIAPHKIIINAIIGFLGF